MLIVATASYIGTFDVADNVRRHIEMIDAAVEQSAELVVFPECSLHGYPDQRMRGTSEGRAETRRRGEEVQNGAASSRVIEHAVRRGVHVVFGMHESSGGQTYNTAVLAGPLGVIGSYRKVHLGAFETSTWTGGEHWPVFETSIGRIGLLICADKAWAESTRELALGGAELLVMPTAWSFDVADPSTRAWAEYYLLFDRVRAAENSRWLVSSNLVGRLGDTTFGGFSQVVDPFGSVVATSGPEPGLVLAEIDVAARIASAEAMWGGPRLERDRRPHTYRRQLGNEPRRHDPGTAGSERPLPPRTL